MINYRIIFVILITFSLNFQNLSYAKNYRCKGVLKIYDQNIKESILNNASRLFDIIFFTIGTEKPALTLQSSINLKNNLNKKQRTFLFIFLDYAQSVYDFIDKETIEKEDLFIEKYKRASVVINPFQLKNKKSSLKEALEKMVQNLNDFNSKRVQFNQDFQDIIEYEDMKSFFKEKGIDIKIDKFDLMLRIIMEEVSKEKEFIAEDLMQRINKRQ